MKINIIKDNILVNFIKTKITHLRMYINIKKMKSNNKDLEKIYLNVKYEFEQIPKDDPNYKVYLFIFNYIKNTLEINKLKLELCEKRYEIINLAYNTIDKK